MTRDEIIRMAREAKLPSDELYHPNLERFAALVTAAAVEREREACAEICDNYDAMNWDDYGEHMTGLGDKIRARGETK